MKKIIILGIGILFLAISTFFMILYLNVFTFGYSFLDYVHFINRKIECLLFYIGFILIVVGLKKKG